MLGVRAVLHLHWLLQSSYSEFSFVSQVALIVSSDVKISSNEKLPHFIYKVPYEPGFLEELLVKPAID